MKISTQSRYGVRAILDIACHTAGRSSQVKDIAARQAISPRYIEQIFQKLKRAGIIRSIRGPLGGYYLAKSPGEISVGDIVRAAEGRIDLVDCSRAGCDRMARCVARDVWSEASARMMAYLDGVTIDDLCREARSRGVEGTDNGRIIYHI